MKIKKITLLICCFVFTFKAIKAQGNSWVQKANFGGGGRDVASSFSIGSKGYLLTGGSISNTYLNDLWEYDAINNSWTQKALLPAAGRSRSSGFSINNKGYVVGGSNFTGFLNELWEYDPGSNTWLQKASFPGVARFAATAFSIGSKGYYTTGSNGSQFYNDLWEYDPATNNWIQKLSLPVARHGARSFSIGSKAYVTTGYNGVYLNDLWEYDPSLNIWTQKTSLPAAAARGYAVCFSALSKGYLATGLNNSYLNDLWEYDPSLNAWTQKTSLPTTPRIDAVSFSINDKGYVGTGYGGTHLNDFWEYTPCQGNIPTISASGSTTICPGGSVTLTSSSASGNQWYKDDIIITGATNLTYTATQAGLYSVIVTDANGCRNSSDATNVVISSPIAVMAITTNNPTSPVAPQAMIFSGAGQNVTFVGQGPGPKLTGGRTNIYSNINTNSYGGLWWTFTPIENPRHSSQGDISTGQMVFSSYDPVTRIITFTSTANMTWPSVNHTENIATRLRMQLQPYTGTHSGPIAAGLPFVTAGDISLASLSANYPLIDIKALGSTAAYQVWYIIETASGVPLDVYYGDPAHNSSVGGITVTSQTGSFFSSTLSTCNGGPATVTVTATGGTGPYTGTGVFSAAIGEHTYTVTDANGCNGSATINVMPPTPIVVTAVASNNATGPVAPQAMIFSGAGQNVTFVGQGPGPKLTGGRTNIYSNINTNSYGGLWWTFTPIENPRHSSQGDISTGQMVFSSYDPVTRIITFTSTANMTWPSVNHTENIATRLRMQLQPYTGTHSGPIAAGLPFVTAGDISLASLSANYPLIDIKALGSTAAYQVWYIIETASGVPLDVYYGDPAHNSSVGGITVTSQTGSFFSSTLSTCNGGPATVTVTATGGTGPYTGTGVFSAAIGEHTYTVTDANGCNGSATINVMPPTPIVVTAVASNNATGPVAPQAMIFSGAGQNVTFVGQGPGPKLTGGRTNIYSNINTNSYGGLWWTFTPIENPRHSSQGDISTGQMVFSSYDPVTRIITFTSTANMTWPSVNHTENIATRLRMQLQPYTGTHSGPIAAGLPFVTAGDISLASLSANYPLIDIKALGSTAAYQVWYIIETASGVPLDVYYGDPAHNSSVGGITVTSQTGSFFSSTLSTCNGGPATVTVTATGGTGPYTGTGVFSAAIGEHTYTVTDANGCNGSATINVMPPTPIVVTAVASNNATGPVAPQAMIFSGAGQNVTFVGQGPGPKLTGGRTNIYSNINTNSYGGLWWTFTPIENPRHSSQGDISTGQMVFSSYDPVTRIITFTSTANMTWPSVNHTENIATRLRMQLQPYTGTHSGPIAAGLPFVTAGDISLASLSANYPLIDIKALGSTAAYQVWYIIETASGVPLDVYYGDPAHNSSVGGITVTSQTGSFFSSTLSTCNGGPATVTVTATGGTGPYTGTGVFSAAIGEHTYTVTDANGCNGSATINVMFGNICDNSITINSTLFSFTCPGSTFGLSYIASGTYNAGNIFTAQLSDNAGSFANPVNIGSVTASSSGSISCDLPVNLPAGTGYRIRIVSSNPDVISPDNGTDMEIKVMVTYYRDADGDGYGTAGYSLQNCFPIPGFVENNDDCNDNNPNIYPGAFTDLSPASVLDPSFGNNGAVTLGHIDGVTFVASALQQDGKLIAYGYTPNLGITRIGLLARYNEDGTLDNSFGENGVASIDIHAYTEKTIGVQPDGKIIICGVKYVPVGNSLEYRIFVNRYNSDGSIDTDFGTQGSFMLAGGGMEPRAKCLTIQLDGKIIVGGYWNHKPILFRLNANGTADNSFNGNGVIYLAIGSEIVSVLLQPNGKIIAAGSLSYQNTLLIRYNPDGTVDNSFNITQSPNVAGLTSTAALQPDGKILLVSQDYGENFYTVFRFNSNGSFDNSFANGVIVSETNIMANSIAIQPDGRILIGGSEGNVILLQRYNSNGSIDNSFADNGSSRIIAECNSGFINSLTISNNRIYGAGRANNPSHGVVLAYKLQWDLNCPDNKEVNADPGLCSAIVNEIDPGVYPISLVNYILSGATTGSGSGSASGLEFNSGTTTVTYSAVDDITKTCSFEVTVIDHESPVLITAPANVTVNTDPGKCYATIIGLPNPTVSDNCGIIAEFNNAPANHRFNKGVTTVTWTVVDAAGNQVTSTQTVTVIDNESPVLITSPANVTVNTDPGKCYATITELPNPTVNDNCGIIAEFNNAPQNHIFNKGITTVTWTDVDAAGSQVTSTQTVTVVDKEAPTFSCPSNRNVNLLSNCKFIVPDLLNGLTGTDNCSGVSFSQVPVPNTLLSGQHNGQYNVTITATDGNGNSSTCIVILTAMDITPPHDFTCPSDRILNLDNNCQITVPDIVTGLSTTDNCGTVTFTQTPAAGTKLNAVHNQNFNFHVTASDGNGNAIFCTMLATAKDVTPPVITYCPVVPVQCYNANGTYSISALTATDNCKVPTVSYVISGATTRSGNGSNASGTFNPGTSAINWTVNDGNGNISTCTTTVVIDKIDASIADAFAANINSSIGSPNTIYIGYGGSSVILSAQVTSSVSPNAFTYKWTIGSPAGPAIGTGPTFTASPTTTTVYYLSVKSANNCAPVYQVSKQINVLDIRCGTNKVYVCKYKNGSYTTNCIQATTNNINNLGAGSYLGPCASQTITAKGTNIEEVKPIETFNVNAFPNPSNSSFNIIIQTPNQIERIQLRVININGQVIERKENLSAGEPIKIGERYITGVYMIDVTQGKQKGILKLVKM